MFRVGRRPDPWHPMPWTAAGPDGTFGNRFDDPRGVYRVLYASSERRGCFLETLARFRTDLVLLAALDEIEGDSDHMETGTVPAAWFPPRVIGDAGIMGRYADIYAAEWLGSIRRNLAPAAIASGANDVDAAFLQQSMARAATQAASRTGFELGFDGVFYRSRFGHDIQNWALFEPFLIETGAINAISQDDPELCFALSIHRLRLEAAPQ